MVKLISILWAWEFPSLAKSRLRESAGKIKNWDGETLWIWFEFCEALILWRTIRHIQTCSTLEVGPHYSSHNVLTCRPCTASPVMIKEQMYIVYKRKKCPLKRIDTYQLGLQWSRILQNNQQPSCYCMFAAFESWSVLSRNLNCWRCTSGSVWSSEECLSLRLITNYNACWKATYWLNSNNFAEYKSIQKNTPWRHIHPIRACSAFIGACLFVTNSAAEAGCNIFQNAACAKLITCYTYSLSSNPIVLFLH